VTRKRRWAWIGVAAVAVALLSAGAAWVGVNYDALLLLGYLADSTGRSRLERTTPEPVRTPIAFAVAGRRGEGDLYLPAAGAPQAGIVLVPGAVRDGRRDARLVAMANGLARLRFGVLVPELRFSGELRIHAGHVRDVADAFRYLVQREDLAPEGRAGIAGISYAVGPALLAALEHDLAHRVRFVLGVGGYHDLRAAIRFFTTGYFEHDGQPRHLQPDPYALLVLARSLAADVREPSDRNILEAMVAAKLADRDADIAPLARQLGPEGQAVYSLLTNREPGRTQALIAALPAASQATIGALTLHDKKLEALSARLILVHGRNDRLIPYTETLALARAVESGRAHVFVLNRVLGHVDLGFSGLFSTRLWAEELPDALRLVRATSLLLRERRAPPGRPRAAAGRASRAGLNYPSPFRSRGERGSHRRRVARVRARRPHKHQGDRQ
jgi:hypothetical protein